MILLKNPLSSKARFEDLWAPNAATRWTDLYFGFISSFFSFRFAFSRFFPRLYTLLLASTRL